PDSGPRTPDSGPRTPDPGFRTPGPGAPDIPATNRPMLLPAVNPEYARSPRSFTTPQNTVHSLVVMVNESGLMVGEVMDIIATVSPVLSPGAAQIAFARPVGREMGISFEEARRAAQVRYPFWEPARITVSFGDKYSAKDGGSAGGAFALLLLSLLDGLPLDSGFAMTGDVTVDWRIRKVGAVAEKIRGAARAGCARVAVPLENERDVADMTLLYPPDVLLGVQVFGVASLGELVEVARADRRRDLAQAIEQYRSVQQKVRRNSLLALSDAAVQETLAGVLKLAPGHLSAKYLLLYARGRSPTRLSLATSMQQIVACTGPLLVFLAPVAPAEVNLPDDAFRRARQSLAELRHKLDRDAEPLHAALLTLVTTLEKMNQVQAGGETPSLKATKLKTFAPRLEADRQKVLSILRALQENQEFLERITG
ncbi:MAG: S16 family serine protease, partial [bacterium]